jgi:hypothetical protein
MSEELLHMVDLSKAELAPEVEIEDEELGLLRCRECGLAWTSELFEDLEATERSRPWLSCPRRADDGRSTPLVPMGGVERRPLVRGGTVRKTYFYNPETLEHLGLEEKEPGRATREHQRRRHALHKAILRALGQRIGR